MAKKRIKMGYSIYRTFVKLSICEIIKLIVVKRFSLSNCFQKNEINTNNFILNTTILLVKHLHKTLEEFISNILDSNFIIFKQLMNFTNQIKMKQNEILFLNFFLIFSF